MPARRRELVLSPYTNANRAAMLAPRMQCPSHYINWSRLRHSGRPFMERRAILVRGIVQGVGFRPFVYNMASRLGLAGFVRNQTGTLHIEVEGESARLEQFLHEITDRPPPLARIEQVSWEQCC